MKNFTLKTLLFLAIMLIGGGNCAWADTGDITTNANINFDDAEITDGVITGTVNSILVGAGELRTEQTGWLSLYDGTSTITIPELQRACSKDVVTVSFKMAWGNKKNMGSGFSLEDKDGGVIANFQYARWDTSATSSNNLNINMSGLVGDKNNNNSPDKSKYTTFTISLDYATKTITSVVTCPTKSGEGVFYATLTNTNPVATFNVWGCGVGDNQDRASIIDDIQIQTTEGDYSVEYADYTVHFQDNNGTKVKEDDVRNGVVGAIVNANAGDKVTFIADGSKYIYSSDGSGTTVTANGEAEFTVTYTKYVSTTYHVNAQAGGENILTDMVTGSAYLDGSTTAFWSKYINVSDQWYVADETTYSAAITTATTNVAYTATDAIDYFFEFEDMNISSSYNNQTGDTRFSNGAAKTLGSNGANAKTTSTIAAGVYTISMYGIKWDDKSDNYRVSYSTDGTNWIALGDISYGDTEEGLSSLYSAIIPTASYIKFETTNGSKTPRRYMDYITFTKTADIPTTENIVVTSAGFATYVSNYNLDFTSATTKAYKVSVTEKGVATVEEVDEVPAKTPVLLYAKGGNGSGEAIPVTTDAVAAISGNNLVAGTGAEVATTVDDYTNMILNNGASGVGFYFANGKTVAANRAYLHIATDMAPDVEPGAKALRVVVNGEATEVVAPEVAETEEPEVLYNMAGIQVDKNFKGFVINQKGVKRFNR